MDGVIVDTAKYHFKAWARLADVLGVPFDEEKNELLKGVSRVDSLERILAWGNLEIDNRRKLELMERKNKWYLDYVDAVNPTEILPGAKEFLEDLKSNGIQIGLGSSSKNAVMILEKLGIMHLFDVIIDGNKIHLSKPHPEVFLKGAKELGVQPENIVVFEDAISGVDAAIAGGFYCIGIGDELTLKKAHAVIPDLDGMTVGAMKAML
jgi:beta-phosphoglucomutase